jgi:hypothetical protein
MPSNQTHAEKLQAEFRREPFTDPKYREAAGYRDGLKALLTDESVTEALAFANRIQEIGLGLPEDFHGKSLDEMRQEAENALAELEGSPPLASPEIGAVSASEQSDKNAVPQVYLDQYNSLPNAVKEKLDWTELVTRLLENDGAKLKQAEAMPRGAELFGVDAEGKALFRNRGVEPVMFAFNQEGEMAMFPERDSDEFRAIKPLADHKTGKARWAKYADVHPWAKEHGYEFFPYDIDDTKCFSDEMKQVTDNIAQEFLVASADEKEWRSVWLASGDNPGHVQLAYFAPVVRVVDVGAVRPGYADAVLGAALLLRV